MIVPESWLRSFCNPPISGQALADRLTMAGIEVEAYQPYGPQFSGVVVGEVLSVDRHPNAEKLSEYECGFPAFEDPRSQFDVRFYLIAILFIVFDLEAAFLFPWAVSLDVTGWPGWITMMVFLFELAVGLAYAWKKGALEWE